MDEGLSRRGFLRRSAAVGATALSAPGLAWTPEVAVAAPAGFPPDIPVERRRFRNWARDIRADDVLTCVPRTATEVVAVVNSGGTGYGSLSDAIVSLTAVVWDGRTRNYVLRTFDRGHPHCKAFMTHLGRAFVTEVTLQVVEDVNLRCMSFIDIPAHELFAAPRSGATQPLAAFVEETGRIEAIWYAHSAHPWLKVWSAAPARPAGARHVTAPYNYPFSDNLPAQASDIANRLITGAPELAPAFGQALYAVTAAGLPATLSQDLWGASRNLLLYVRPTTLRVTANGYAVLTARRDVQRVVSAFTSFYRRRLAAYAAQGRYPINVALEIRVSGLDTAPVLSAVRRRADNPAWDVAVWFDVLTFPGTPFANRFYRELETWTFAAFSGQFATVRPEWSKGWAYTDRAAWSDPAMLTRIVPGLYRAGRGRGDDWDWAVAVLDAHDPHHVFGNGFLDVLLRRRRQNQSIE